MTVGWKVNALSARIASVRYRALLPMLALEGAGVRSHVFADARFAGLAELDALVIVKSFTAEDLRLAQEARARGIPVLLDLCDNIFIPGYGGRRKGPTPAQVFVAMAEHAVCIVTTTEPLADVIRAHVEGARVEVVPDGIELTQLEARMVQVVREASGREQQGRGGRAMRHGMRNALHRVRDEGVGALPSLVRSAVRRVGGAFAGRVRHSLQAGPQPDTAAADLPAVAPGTRRIVWFGNHGAEHARFGMLDILEWRTALEAVAAQFSIELVVISNDREKFEAHVRPLPFATRYVEWSPAAVSQWLASASAVIVPNSLDPFSVCKSANRTVTALAHGVPVVATMTPALRTLGDAVETGDPLQALLRILREPAPAQARARDGYRRAQMLFGEHALAARWLDLLQQSPRTERRPEPELAVLLHLVQDLDLAVPILQEASRAGMDCEAWCTGSLLAKSPRVLATLKSQDIAYRVLPDEEELASFRFPARTRSLLTVAETSLGPHRIPRLLTEAAVREGRFAATLQHGFENVGLTYEDELHTFEKVSIAAQRIYIWGPPETLHPRVDADVRARCVPVGCPKADRVPPAELQGLLPRDRPVVGIFENLHWHRYPEGYRHAFLQNVAEVARAWPHVLFLVKPHHAGMWLTHRYEGTLPDAGNLLVADPQSPEWEGHTAGALLPHLSAVITTPSTVALDAARQPLPVAVVAGELPLANYQPLPLLRSVADWNTFLASAMQPAGRASLAAQGNSFVQRVLVPGNAARRIVEDLKAVVPETEGA
jgi:glycosyltransferase involved in cell wall biosynthesis